MEIPAIKQQLSILAVLSHYGLVPDRNHRLSCPFHPDKTPSLQIYPKTNTYCCFSSNCQAGTGDQINFIERMEKCTRHQALVKAAALAGEEGSGPPQSSAQTPAAIQGDLLAQGAVLQRLFAFFKKALPLTAKATDYLKGRGLDYRKHEVGYNAGDWHHQLSEKHFITSAERCGLLKASPVRGYKAWGRDCVIFPLKDAAGKLISLYGRSLTGDSAQRHFYLSGRQGLYPGYPKPDTTLLILTESIIDAASLLQQPGIAGNYSVLALYGTSGLSGEHLEAIGRLENLEEIVLMLDSDLAGDAAALKHYHTLSQLVPRARITKAELPPGEDPNSLLQSHDDPGVLSHLVEQRRDFSFSTENKTQDPEPPSSADSALDTRNPQLLVYSDAGLYVEVLGGLRVTGLERMKVTLKITARGRGPEWHSLDLYHHSQREQAITSLSESLDLPVASVTTALVKLTAALEAHRLSRLEALQPRVQSTPAMSDQDRELALSELKHTRLVERTGELIGLSGIVGEDTNRLVAYLAYSTRKQEVPLHVMLLGSSGSGKTWLQERISALIPQEDRIQITQITGNALYYFGRRELSHKLLLIEDLDGAAGVLYPLRELQTKRQISKTVTLKDSRGNLRTITLVVEGPVAVSGCTTREKMYEDNANRCILLYTDPSREQDRRINEYQGALAAGEVNRQREQRYGELFCHMQRLLAPVSVLNPYAGYIQLPPSVFRPRRTMGLLLGFIEAVTFYHQYQRKVKYPAGEGEPYIETTIADIGTAFRLIREVLFARSDELGGATREFLERLKGHLKNNRQDSFCPQQVRTAFRLEPRTLQRYTRELRQYGLLRAVGSYRQHRGFEYRLGDEGEYRRLTAGIDGHLEEVLTTLKNLPATPTATAGRQ